MSEAFARSLNRSPPAVKAWIKSELKAGEEMEFLIVDESGTRHLSHTIRHARGAYHLCDWDSAEAGSFATLSAAMTAGFAASAEALQHGL